ncbi:33058_t:CDS:1, partial [Racocetra persica]
MSNNTQLQNNDIQRPQNFVDTQPNAGDLLRRATRPRNTANLVMSTSPVIQQHNYLTEGISTISKPQKTQGASILSPNDQFQ